MLRLGLKPPNRFLCFQSCPFSNAPSQIHSSFHSYSHLPKKGVSIPQASLFFRPSMPPHCLQSNTSRRSETSDTTALPPPSPWGMPTTPHGTQEALTHSQGFLPHPGCFPLLLTLFSLPAKASLPFFSWQWKHPQHSKGRKHSASRKPCVKRLAGPDTLLLCS